MHVIALVEQKAGKILLQSSSFSLTKEIHSLTLKTATESREAYTE